MTVVLAAIDAGPAAPAVLETALGIGELMQTRVEAVHVREGPTDNPTALAAHHRIPLRILERPVTTSLLDAVSDPNAIAAVFGARATRLGRRPVGHTALHVLERAKKPIIVVPPEAVGMARRQFRRLLVPLEGNEQSARPVTESLYPLISGNVELVVLHVFTPATVPRTLDRPGRDLSLWGDEFLARFCPDAATLELRSGAIGGRVDEVCIDSGADLIVLSWSQDSSPGHAAVDSRRARTLDDSHTAPPGRHLTDRIPRRGGASDQQVSSGTGASTDADGDTTLGGADPPPGHLRRHNADPAHVVPGPPQHLALTRHPGDRFGVSELFGVAHDENAPPAALIRFHTVDLERRRRPVRARRAAWSSDWTGTRHIRSRGRTHG